VDRPDRRWDSLLLLLLGLAVYGLCRVAFDVAPAAHPSNAYPLFFYPQLALYGVAAWWTWRRPKQSLWLILGFAMAFRIAAVAHPPSLSSDVHRYPWDGLVQRAGFNPYEHPPEAPELAHLADDVIHPEINRPWARTVYPPGGQLLYRALPYDIDLVRLAMVGFDALTMLLIVVLLRRLRLDPSRVILYAWSPFVVWEVGNNGHLEAAMLPLLLGAVLLWRSGRHGAAGLSLGGAVAMKLYPLLGVVALLRPKPWRILLPIGLLVGGLYLAYGWSIGPKVLGFLPEYVGSAEDHNIGLRALLAWLLDIAGLLHPREVAFGLCLAALAGGLLWLWRRPAPPELQLLRIAGLYLLTLPTAFHPWYALWLVPWLCVHPRASWLWLLSALPLSYLKYATPDGVMPPWVVPVELVPVFALLVWEARRRRAPTGEAP
jgi:alpha-1,6-mannosyltransferase